MIHDILDNAVSKWVGNTAHTLAYLLNPISRQHGEVLGSQFPLTCTIKDSFPPTEVYLN